MANSNDRRASQGGTPLRRRPAESFEDLDVWQRAHQFVLQVYRTARTFPKDEMYGLTSQIRRAAVSVPANIAEGFKRTSKQEKLRFLNIAQGSLEECRYYLILAADLEYADTTSLKAIAQEVSRLLHRYIQAIRASKDRPETAEPNTQAGT